MQVMQWKCKFCLFSCEKRARLLKHYRLKHGSYTRSTPIPCLYTDCLCSFKSFNALRVHLTKNHSYQAHGSQSSPCDNILLIFHCPLCSFEEPCTESIFFLICGSISKIMKLCSVHTTTAILRAMSTLHLIPINVESMEHLIRGS